MAANDSTLVDGDGNYSDWIELYNSSGSPADITGYYLTDDTNNLTKWQFPTTNITAQGFLVVFASGQNTDDYVDSLGYLHTNFKLSRNDDGENESLALVLPDSVTIAHAFPDYPPQFDDISYGLSNENPTNEALYFEVPTPGALNSTGTAGFVSEPLFSVKRGFYNTSFDVIITTATENSEIYYTVNGVSPSISDGNLYSGAITITNTTILRAAAFRTNYISSSVETHTYIFISDVVVQSPNGETPGSDWPSSPVNGQVVDYGMDPDIVNDSSYSGLIGNSLTSIPSISLVTDPDNLFDSNIGIYVNPESDGRDWERETSVELLNPDESQGFQINSGLRIRGGMSRTATNPKHSFRLFFRSEYGASKLNFPLFGDEGVDEYDKIDLRTGQNFSWNIERGGGPGPPNSPESSFPGEPSANYATWLYDIFSRDTQHKMGQTYSRGRFYHLFLNGQYWGLYQTDERTEANYAESYFGYSDEDYDAVKSDNDNGEVYATDGNLVAYSNLWSQVNNGMSDISNYFCVQGMNTDQSRNQSYTRLLDVDNLIDYMIIVFFTGNRDMPIGPPSQDSQPRNLFTIYNRKSPDGFKFITHDCEHSIEIEEGVNLNRVNTTLKSALSLQKNCTPWWIHSKLEDNSEYLLRFADKVHEYFFNNGILTPDVVTNRFLPRASEIELAVIAESARWGDYLYPDSPRTKNDDWLPVVTTLVDDYFLAYPSTRTEVVLSQLNSRGLYPNFAAPVFSQQGGIITDEFSLSISSSYPIYYTIDGTDPREPITGNPVGTLYTEPISLPYSAKVKARVLNSSTWTALNSAVFVADEEVPLKVSEIMYHPADPTASLTNYSSSDFEFIELQNIGTQTIGLAGIKFTEGIIFDFSDGNVPSLDPGEYVVLIDDQFAFYEKYTNWADMKIAGEFKGKFFLPGALDNSSEKLTLVDGKGNTIQSFTYEDSWYPQTDGGGYSLTIIDPYAETNSWNSINSWRPSTFPGGTPGFGPVTISGSGLFINEFLAINETTITDNFGGFEDWIELLNFDSNTIELSGMFLTDDLSDPTKWSFPDTNLAAGDFLLLWADNETNKGVLHLPFKLSGNGEEIGLFNRSEDGTTLLHSVVYGEQYADISYGLFPDATGVWTSLAIPTPGSSNIIPEPYFVYFIIFLFSFRKYISLN